MLLDIHSHHLHEKPDTTIWSCSMKDRHSPDFSRAVWISAGIHPWFLSDNDMEAQIKWLESVLLSDRRVLAVGEAGLDKLCQTPFDVQQKAFNASIRLSEKHRLPLIIHTVRCFNELIALKKEVCPSQPWIIHGFRGKKELAGSLVRQGFYLSLGEKFNPETLRAIPPERLLAETDESHKDISALVRKMSETCEVSPDMFRTRLCLNARHLFFNR